MDCVRIPAAALRTGFFMDGSSPTHYLYHNTSGNNQAEEAWALEKGAGLVGGGDEFFVDDLLDFDGIVDGEHGEEEEEGGDRMKEDEDKEENGSNSSSSSSKSGVSFEELAAATDPVVPVGDICDLEWVSQFVDDSSLDIPCSALAPPFRSTVFAALKPETKLYVPTSQAKQQTSHCRSPSTGSIASSMSPGAAGIISSSSSLKRTWPCFSDNPLAVPSKARSKRIRTTSHLWSRHPHFSKPLCSSSLSSSSSSCSATSSLSSYLPLPAERHPGAIPESIVHRGRGRPPLHKKSNMFKVLAEELKKPKKKKGRKPKTAAISATAMPPSDQEGSGSGGCGGRVCSHCGVSKTPQWRTGPMGAKTLCNACGVRYKSGRLLPEYRPASSPTFMSHVHSNSHRKVLEMRRKKELGQLQQLSSSDSDSSGHMSGDSSGGQSCGDSSETPAAAVVVGGAGFLAPLAAPLPAQAMVF